MQRLFVKDAGGTIAAIDPSRISDVPAGSWLWLDVTDPTPDEVLAIGRHFAFDHLSLEDVLEPSQFPKVDDVAGYLFVVMHAAAPPDGDARTVEIDAFVGERYLVTFHPGPVPGIDWLADEAASVPALAEGGPDRMLARLTEVSARRFLPMIEELEGHLEELEDLSVEGHPEIPGAVQSLRRDTLAFRRLLGPQREVVLSLAREGRDLITPPARRRFADAYDLLFRIVETLDGERAQLGAILETHRSTVAERMNEVVTVLTVFSAILLPISVMAGIYGMNFEDMPGLAWRWGFAAILGLMAVTAGGLWVYFVRRRFVGGPRLHRLPVGVARRLGRSASGTGALIAAPMRVVAGALGPRRGRSQGRAERGPPGAAP